MGVGLYMYDIVVKSSRLLSHHVMNSCVICRRIACTRLLNVYTFRVDVY